MVRDFYADLMQHALLPVTTTLSGQPLLSDIQKRHDSQRFNDYLQMRDNYRNSRLSQPPTTEHWRGTSVRVAAALHTTIFDRGRQAQLTRQLWHWGFTGYNKAKTLEHTSADCVLCNNLVEDEEHIL